MKLANLKTQAPPVNFSNHNLTHSVTTSIEMGDLVPILFQEVLPNDRIDLQHEFFIRFSPLVAPILSEVNLKLYTFFVPSRCCWTKFKKFMSEKTINESPDKPYCRVLDIYRENLNFGYRGFYFPTSLCDYMGLPMAQFYSGARDSTDIQNHGWKNDKLPLAECQEPIDLLPFYAYQAIYYRWFRDENLEPAWLEEDADISDLNGQVDPDENIWQLIKNGSGYIDINQFPDVKRELFQLRRKAYEKDYFTSALPSPQFGEPIEIPVEATIKWSDIQATSSLYDAATNQPISWGDGQIVDAYIDNTTGNIRLAVDDGSGNTQNFNVAINNVNHLEAAGGSFTINEFRMASAIQRYQEALMRAGHRYEEQMRYQFDQIVPNSHLEEPELIHASSVPVNIDAVTQTSGDMQLSGEQLSTPQGTQTGTALAYNNGRNMRFRYHCPDHGFIVTLACVLPRTTYMNGLPRMFSRFSRLDYYNPLFENVGDEAILNKELFLGTDNDANNREFGYMPRFADYKVGFNKVTGEMANTLLMFHLGRSFASLPGLNQDFIKVDRNTTNRSFVDTSSDHQHLWCIGKNHLFMRRPMQYNPIPKLI